MKIEFAQLKAMLYDILKRHAFDHPKAELTARLFAEASLDGYHSHGVNRFAEFIKNVRNGIIDPQQEPTLKLTLGSIEQWVGHRGPGPANAYFAMDRAINLAKLHNLGCVALSDTNHWMRGGSYGWQAAEAGFLAICFTNTMPNMAPWGGLTHTTGNNPFIVAIPNRPTHIVLDMSLSQFSYGQLYKHQLEGKQLPLSGGYDEEGVLTMDPMAILKTKRLLPTGYWKGSGLSLVLDLLASILSQGLSTAHIGGLDYETGLSQVFICIKMEALGDPKQQQQLISEVLSFFTSSQSETPNVEIRYPGWATYQRRKRQLEEGIEINSEIWREVVALLEN